MVWLIVLQAILVAFLGLYPRLWTIGTVGNYTNYGYGFFATAGLALLLNITLEVIRHNEQRVSDDRAQKEYKLADERASRAEVKLDSIMDAIKKKGYSYDSIKNEIVSNETYTASDAAIIMQNSKADIRNGTIIKGSSSNPDQMMMIEGNNLVAMVRSEEKNLNPDSPIYLVPIFGTKGGCDVQLINTILEKAGYRTIIDISVGVPSRLQKGIGREVKNGTLYLYIGDDIKGQPITQR